VNCSIKARRGCQESLQKWNLNERTYIYYVLPTRRFIIMYCFASYARHKIYILLWVYYAAYTYIHFKTKTVTTLILMLSEVFWQLVYMDLVYVIYMTCSVIIIIIIIICIYSCLTSCRSIAFVLIIYETRKPKNRTDKRRSYKII